MAESHLCRRRGNLVSSFRFQDSFLFQVPNNLMTVRPTVLPTADMNPIILLVGSLKNQLIEISIVLQPIEPLTGHLHVGMTLVVRPGGIRG